MSTGQLNFHREGSGTPLVLVHGIAATWQCWLPVIPALASRHDVIIPDLPGFGGSVALGVERPSLEHFAKSILDLLDELGIDRFHVAGNSLGGAIAVELLKSGRVDSYTGISPAGQTYGPWSKITKALLRGSYYGSIAMKPLAPQLMKFRPLRILSLAQMVGKPQRLTAEYSTELVVGCAIGKGFSPTLKYAIPNHGIDIPPYDGPAQILWGTRDRILPISAAARYAKKWPSMTMVELPGLGHVPMQDDPKLVADKVLTFVGRAEAARAASGRSSATAH